MVLKSHSKLTGTYFHYVSDILLIGACYSDVDGLFQMNWILPLRIMESKKEKKNLNPSIVGNVFCILQRAYSTKVLIYNK